MFSRTAARVVGMRGARRHCVLGHNLAAAPRQAGIQTIASITTHSSINNSDTQTFATSSKLSESSGSAECIFLTSSLPLRFSRGGRPLVVMGMCPRLAVSDMSSSFTWARHIQKRVMSSRSKNDNRNSSPDHRNTNEKNSKQRSSPPQEQTVNEKVSDQQQGGGGRLSSIMHSVGPTLRKVTEWNVPDLLAIYAVVILIALIVFSPYVVEQMKRAESEYMEVDEYDPVAQMEKIVRYEVFGDGDVELMLEDEEREHDEDGEPRKSIDNTIGMAADVLQSETLQEAIASLITRVIDSVQFQQACQKLLKNLWNDLVNDPETTAQVVALLNNAIQNKEIQRSVRRLVLQLIKDKEVYDELTRLLVRLGQEDEVLEATRSLLTESAHNALNDPEILDHSMEFATDVVGDDIVQRTSGEALRNTVSYAVGPGVSTLLSILGIGLVWFSISAFRQSRATEQEAEIVDKAVASMARSIQVGTREGVATVASLPGRLWSMIASIITFPFRMAERGFSGVWRAGDSVVSTVSSAIHFVIALPGVILRAAMRQLERIGFTISDEAFNAISRIGSAISSSFVGQAARSVAKATTGVVSVLSGAMGFICNAASTSAQFVGASLSKLSAKTASVLSATGTCVRNMTEALHRFVGKAAARLGGEDVRLRLSKISSVLIGAIAASRTSVCDLFAAGSRFASAAVACLGGVCSQFGSIIKVGVIGLAAKSVHAQTVALDTVKRFGSQCGAAINSAVMSITTRTDHATAVMLEVAENIGASLATAGARVSASIALVASWCIRFFKRHGKDDGPAAAPL